MTLPEELAASVRADLKGLTFSQTLEEYLRMRAQGADESSGYSDKAYYYTMEALRERMDAMTNHLEEDL